MAQATSERARGWLAGALLALLVLAGCSGGSDDASVGRSPSPSSPSPIRPAPQQQPTGSATS